MTPSQQEMYIRAALRKLERETGITVPTGNIAEARQKLKERTAGR